MKLNYMHDRPSCLTTALVWFYDTDEGVFYSETFSGGFEWPASLPRGVIAVGWVEVEQPTQLLMERLAEIRQEQLEERDYVREMTRHPL